MQLLLVMKTEKLKLDENRIRETVSFESVNVDSDFFLSNARDKTKNIFLCFLKEVDRIMQNSSECLFYSFFMENQRKSPKCNLSVTELNGFDKF